MNLPGYVNKMSEVKEYEGTPSYSFFSFEKGTKEKSVQVHFLYVLGNHLGSVLVTCSDRKIAHSQSGNTIDYYIADIVSAQDFYPFGEILPGRSFSSNSYNYGYQGSMKDDEISGVTGANFTTFYREGDTRKGQWDTPDSKPDASWSPYVMMNDNPIMNNDVMGDIPWPVSATFNLNNITFNRGVTSGWLRNSWPYHGAPHGGADIAFVNGYQPAGATIVATHQGKVIFAGPSNSGYGTMVKIQYADEIRTLYGHMSQTTVSTGENVTEGQPIGFMGTTGFSQAPHVHYELWVKNAKTGLLEKTNPFVGNPDYVPNVFDPVALKDPQKMLGLPSIADVQKMPSVKPTEIPINEEKKELAPNPSNNIEKNE